MHPQTDKLVKFKTKVFDALSDSTRLEILEFLRTGEKCVYEIIPHVGLIQPMVSRHLKILKDSGLVRDRKNANRRLYSITDRRVLEIIDAVTPELIGTLSKRIVEQLV